MHLIAHGNIRNNDAMRIFGGRVSRFICLSSILFIFFRSQIRSRIQRVRTRIMPGVADGRDRTRERHPRAASACAREEIRDHWEDREGGETGARHSLLARQHSDLSIDFHDRSRTVRERTNPTNEQTWNERRERNAAPKDLRGAPRISNRACARNLRASGLSQRNLVARGVSTDMRKCRPAAGAFDVSYRRHRIFQTLLKIYSSYVIFAKLGHTVLIDNVT